MDERDTCIPNFLRMIFTSVCKKAKQTSTWYEWHCFDCNEWFGCTLAYSFPIQGGWLLPGGWEQWLDSSESSCSAIIIMLCYQTVLFYSQRKRLVVASNKRVGADVHVTTAASFIFVHHQWWHTPWLCACEVLLRGHCCCLREHRFIRPLATTAVSFSIIFCAILCRPPWNHLCAIIYHSLPTCAVCVQLHLFWSLCCWLTLDDYFGKHTFTFLSLYLDSKTISCNF